MATPNDDFSSDVNTTGIIAVGGTATGVLETSNDADWFKVSLSAGSVYQFALTGGPGNTFGSNYGVPILQIYDPHANAGGSFVGVQQVVTGAAPVVWFKAQASGSYFLSVGNAYATGAYSVKASVVGSDDYSDTATGATALALGDSVSGTLERPGDHDVFKVTLEAGTTYTLSTSGTAAADGSVALPVAGFYTAYTDGTLNNYNSGGAGVSQSFTPTTSGVYYVSVADLDPVHGTGGYSAHLSAAPDDYSANADGAGVVVVGGGAVGGTLNVPQDIDWFKVTLGSNQAYTFQLNDSTNISSLTIVDAQGTSLGAYASTVTGLGQVLSWTPPRAGDYYLQVQSQSGSLNGQNGYYTVQASVTPTDDFSANTSTTGLLSRGQTLTGHIETVYDTDWIKVPLQAGDNYAFGLSSAATSGSNQPAVSFSLVDGHGNPVQYSSQTGSDALLSYAPAASGDYYLLISGQVFSSYTVKSYAKVVDDVAGDASTTAVLALSSAVRSSVDAATDHDWYKVTLAANQSYSFELDGAFSHSGTLGSATVNSSLKLYDASGNVVTSATGGNYSEASIFLYPQTAGTYYLDVSSLGLGTGSYVLRSSGPTGMPDTTPPVLSSLSGPASYGGLSANLVLNFSENLHLGSGTITLSTAAGKVIESFDAATSTHLLVNGSTLSIDPSADLLPGADYVLTITPGSVTDLAGNADNVINTQHFHTVDAPQSLVGSTGNDVFHGGGGGGSFTGGAGLDTLVLSGSSYNFNIVQNVLSTVVTDYYGAREVSTLTGVERLSFDNLDIAFDTRGVAGEVYRLYQAAFGRTPDSVGLGYWIAQADKGASMHDVASNFVTSSEFTKLYGSSPSDASFLNNLYQNVLHRAGDAGGLDYWAGKLEQGVARADVLSAFSESPENQVALYPYMQNGISFTHFLG